MFNTISNWIEAKHHALAARAIEVWVQKKGQGTTEYAILVGVLVVIAIIAITLFRPKIPHLRASQKISSQRTSMRTRRNDRSTASHFTAQRVGPSERRICSGARWIPRAHHSPRYASLVS